MKKSICVASLFLLLFTGCSNKSIVATPMIEENNKSLKMLDKDFKSFMQKTINEIKHFKVEAKEKEQRVKEEDEYYLESIVKRINGANN